MFSCAEARRRLARFLFRLAGALAPLVARRLLAPLFAESGSHGLTADSLCHLLQRVGFTAIEQRAFGGYLLLWAEKPEDRHRGAA